MKFYWWNGVLVGGWERGMKTRLRSWLLRGFRSHLIGRSTRIGRALMCRCLGGREVALERVDSTLVSLGNLCQSFVVKGALEDGEGVSTRGKNVNRKPFLWH